MASLKQIYPLLSSVALAALVMAMGSGVQAQTRFTVSADGQEVSDSTTQLTWRRCVEGMSWDGKTCTGKPLKFSFAAAQKHAASTASSTGKAWRAPTKVELQSLIDKTQKKTKIDGSTFPATPKSMFWATRPETKDNLNAWIVNFGNGKVYGNSGSKAPHIRLVRPIG